MNCRTSLAALALAAAPMAACSPDYSPNTYNSGAVQQANKVDQGVVVGVRAVGVSAAGTVGAVTGGAAGGIVGSQVPGGGVGTAFGALGGTVIGGIVGTTVEHAQGDTTAYEYIVRKTNGDLLSVTQKDEVPLTIGQKVLLIAGNQARIVPDYTVGAESAAEKKKNEAETKPVAPAGTAAGEKVTQTPLAPPATAAPATTAPPSSPAAGSPAALSAAAASVGAASAAGAAGAASLPAAAAAPSHAAPAPSPSAPGGPVMPPPP